MRGKKLLVVLAVVAAAGVVSAARNYILNGGFEDTFTSINTATSVTNTFDGTPGSYAYGADNGQPTNPSYVPGNWGDYGVGYVWNPQGTGGTNHYGTYVGLTNAATGNGCYGSFGQTGAGLSMLQNIRTTAQEGDTVILSWDMNFLSADYSGGWFIMNLQFIGATPPDDQTQMVFPYATHTEPQDVWNHYSITQTVNSAQADRVIQIHMLGAGAWVDNVALQILRPDDDLIANGSFEQPFSGGYGTTFDGTPGAYAYGGFGGSLTIPAFCPHWSSEGDWGYAWNPAGQGGTNHWGTYVGLTNVTDGVAAYGAWGSVAHRLDLTQYTGEAVEEGDKLIFSWDVNFLSADYGSNAYFYAYLQFVGVEQIEYAFPSNNVPYDTWRHYSYTQNVTSAQSGAGVQIALQGAGVFIDNVSLKLVKGNTYAGWIESYSLTGPQADPEYDFEPDGINNMFEYAFGGDPTNPDAAAIRPASDVSGSTWTYIYRRRTDAAVRGLVYDLSYTNNLVMPWADANIYETGTGDTGNPDFEFVTNQIPVGGATEGFIKLDVSE